MILNGGCKVSIVGHSLGGLLVKHFMLLNPDWNIYLRRFVGLTVPFDGGGGYTAIAPIHGYPLKLSFLDPIIGRGIESNSGVINNLSN